eukprot:6483368-Prymnesium_polylepis.1
MAARARGVSAGPPTSSEYFGRVGSRNRSSTRFSYYEYDKSIRQFKAVRQSGCTVYLTVALGTWRSGASSQKADPRFVASQDVGRAVRPDRAS